MIWPIAVIVAAFLAAGWHMDKLANEEVNDATYLIVASKVKQQFYEPETMLIIKNAMEDNLLTKREYQAIEDSFTEVEAKKAKILIQDHF